MTSCCVTILAATHLTTLNNLLGLKRSIHNNRLQIPSEVGTVKRKHNLFITPSVKISQCSLERFAEFELETISKKLFWYFWLYSLYGMFRNNALYIGIHRSLEKQSKFQGDYVNRSYRNFENCLVALRSITKTSSHCTAVFPLINTYPVILPVPVLELKHSTLSFSSS